MIACLSELLAICHEEQRYGDAVLKGYCQRLIFFFFWWFPVCWSSRNLTPTTQNRCAVAFGPTIGGFAADGKTWNPVAIIFRVWNACAVFRPGYRFHKNFGEDTGQKSGNIWQTRVTQDSFDLPKRSVLFDNAFHANVLRTSDTLQHQWPQECVVT